MMENKPLRYMFWKILYHTLILGVIMGLFVSVYLFATRSFSNEAYDAKDERKVTITVKKDDGVLEIAQKLYDNKVIVGKYRFVFRKFFSKYRDVAVKEGTYKVSPSQGLDDILATLAGEKEVQGP